MPQKIHTKEERSNKRVVQIIAALVVAGVAILIATYVPGIFNDGEISYPSDLTEETTRVFMGEIATIDYEKKIFTLALYSPDLYEGYEEGEIATEEEFGMSPWTITSFFSDGVPILDENGEEALAPDSTEIGRITVEIREGENPRVQLELISFDDLKVGDYVQVNFWLYGYSPLTKSITPLSILVSQNPFEGNE